MEKSWDYPKDGFVKINVHALSYPEPLHNGNDSGIGIVIRDDKGDIIVMVSGCIAGITSRANELWGFLAALRLAYYENLPKIQLETDNADAVKEWNDWNLWIDPNHANVIQQLEQRKKDPKLTLEINTVAWSQNALARYLAMNGAENRIRLVIFRRLFGRVGELWRLDMGLGPVEPQYQAIAEVEYGNAVHEEGNEDNGEDAEWLVADLGSSFHAH